MKGKMYVYSILVGELERTALLERPMFTCEIILKRRAMMCRMSTSGLGIKKNSDSLTPVKYTISVNT
jgi:hypothetical protein